MPNEPLPAPVPRTARTKPPGITLFARGATQWLFGLAIGAVAVVWWTESALQQLTPADGWAYPLLIAWFLVLMVVVRHRSHRLVLAQGLGALGLSAYFVGSMIYMLLIAPSVSTYSAASMVYWLVGVHLLIFTTWPLWRALGLSALVGGLALLPVLVVHFRATRPPDWEYTLWPLYLNAFL
ncbi:MAG TPA: hypothetical protein VHQ87_03570, partial [Rhizobacter sp.]|nr:hypothetical protein [Rhizobacter sp.]